MLYAVVLEQIVLNGNCAVACGTGKDYVGW